MNWPFCHSTNLNGPVPTGRLALGWRVMSPVPNTCLGTIGDSYEDSAIIMYGAGSLRRNTAVIGSGVSTAVTARKVFTPRGCTFFSTSITLNCTSALVKGLPSWNLTPDRSLKVIVLPSGLTVHDCARLGMGLSWKSYSSSPS